MVSSSVFFAGAEEAYECPDEYPRRVVVSDSVKDERACSPCACGAPEGAECAALVTLSGDAACASPIAAVTVAPGQPACVDVPSGVALGSKEASFSVDETGKCAPTGGEPVGELAPAGPVTFCCQPDPALPR